ncbi:MAG: four helix bundle suffix domain-containing protein [Bacteroidaceae bacterium]|nr:four helix bundle suffix domain-containing protein [Bacteroidaceae bacterium]
MRVLWGGFLQLKGNYRDLIAFQKAECIYDITHYFCHRYLSKGDRTIDQMVQAARSGKQNIVEASAAATTSSETEIKLMNVARASLHELLADYEDYLRVRGLEQWPADSQKAAQARRACMAHNDSAYYREAIQERSDETIANIAITLLHQEDVFLRKLIDRLQSDFLKQGGIREQMLHARLEYRKRER